jgi:hypothetical protein
MADAPNNGAPTGANTSGGQTNPDARSGGYNTGLGLSNYDLQGQRRNRGQQAPAVQHVPSRPATRGAR